MKAKLWDKSFKYIPAVETDIRKLFAKVRREQKANKEELDKKLTRIGRKVA